LTTSEMSNICPGCLCHTISKISPSLKHAKCQLRLVKIYVTKIMMKLADRLLKFTTLASFGVHFSDDFRERDSKSGLQKSLDLKS
jgi:hypothetical protein